MLTGCASAPSGPTKPAASVGPRAARVIVISVDGLSPDVYRDDAFATPTLHALAKRGAAAEGLIPIYPSVTYPNHVTMVTGVPSRAHGVWANQIFSPEEGPTARWYFDASWIRVPTLWDRAAEQGLSTALFNWPVTLGARAKWVVPEVFPEKGFQMDAIWALTERNTDRALMKFVSAAAGASQFTGTLQHDRWMLEGARAVFKAYQPALTLVHLTHLDVTQHLSGSGTPAHQESARQLDQLLAPWIAELDFTEHCLIVLGDHGFEEVRAEIRVNDLFRARGWITDHPGGKPRWKVAAATLGGPAAVYVRDPALKEEALKVLRENEARGHYRVIERAELDRLQAFPEALAVVEPDPSYGTAKDFEPEGLGRPFVRALANVKGEHGFLPSHPRMLSGFIAVGRCATPGKNLGLVHMTDVAATIAAELGFPWPTDAGRPIPLTEPIP